MDNERLANLLAASKYNPARWQLSFDQTPDTVLNWQISPIACYEM